MTSLVWLFAGMSAVISGYVCYRLTAWRWSKRIKKLKKQYNIP